MHGVDAKPEYAAQINPKAVECQLVPPASYGGGAAAAAALLKQKKAPGVDVINAKICVCQAETERACIA